MGKLAIEATTHALPSSCVVVTCFEPRRGGNMITLAYCAMVNFKPPMVAISVRPSRYSYKLIKEAGDFAVNVPLAEQARVVDVAGVVSGKNVDKFDLAKLTQAPALKIRSPLIEEFPIGLECVLLESIELPTHNLFIGKVVAAQADESLVGPDKHLRGESVPFLVFWNRCYFEMGGKVGDFGFSKTTPEARQVD